jgi:hypothetical protein
MTQADVSVSRAVPRRRYPLIERRAGMDRETLARDYMARSRPVVILTGDRDWCARWSPAALAERFGGCEIAAEETREVYVGERALVRRPLGPVIAGMLAGDRSMRWKGLDFLSRVPPMREDLDAHPSPLAALFPGSMFDARSTLWVAPEGTMSSLHHDGNLDNLNLQLSGRKLWLLIPPPQHDSLYFHGSAESPLNPFAPDLGRFPRFADATPVEALLGPGEAILVPKYWWHCVYTVEPSVNLATCFHWRGERSAWGVLDGAPLLHRSLTTVSASMKRRGLVGLANATRRAWCRAHDLVTPRTPPQPRCRLADV